MSASPLAFRNIPARNVIPQRHYPLFLAVVFLVSLFFAYLTLPIVNQFDWAMTSQQLRDLMQLQDAYGQVAWRYPDLIALELEPAQAFHPPWFVVFFGFISFASAKVVIALSVAAWIVIVLDSGGLAPLLLLIHPTFIMVWASSNLDFLVSGVGLWLILRGVHGTRRGGALALLAVKWYGLPLLLVLEGFRALWTRDFKAIGTFGLVIGIPVALFPGWIKRMIEITGHVNLSGGVNLSYDLLPSYSFSVFGAWGLGAALVITALLLVMMRRQFTEWRILAVQLSLVWTPFMNPYAYAVFLVLFRKSSGWRVLAYLGLSIAALPVFFQEYHYLERYGLVLFLLLATLLAPADTTQREEVIAARSGYPPLPFVKSAARLRDQFISVTS
ncbi:MAG: hypothetical protein AAGU78_01195 [Chloroflexota bacterium]